MVMSILAASVIPFFMIACLRDVYSARSLVTYVSFYETSPDHRAKYTAYDDICPKSDEISRSLEELVVCVDELKVSFFLGFFWLKEKYSYNGYFKIRENLLMRKII